MRQTLLSLAVTLLVACDAPVAASLQPMVPSSPVYDPLPPPAAIALTASPEVTYTGRSSTLSAVLPPQAPAGVKVFFVVSDGAGDPICPGVIAPDCLDITGNFQLAGSVDAVGQVATLNWVVPRVWRSYTLQVQAVVRTARGNHLSTVAEVDVLHPPTDVDGDGFSDWILAAPGEDIGSVVDAGFVSVHRGDGESFLPADQWLALDQTDDGVGTSAEASDGFGGVMATGDFDGDTLADILLGWPLEDNALRFDAGWLAVQYGGTTPGPAAWWNGDSPELGGVSEMHDLLGAALAVADFDNDGYDDAAVGIPGGTVGGRVGAGRVHVLFGGAGGLGTGGSLAFSQADMPSFILDAGDHLGLSLATGDIDGDGHIDLVVGAPLEDSAGRVDNGAVAVMFGSAAGPDPSTTRFLDAVALGYAAEPGAHLGASLAVGDFDADGLDELAIGAPDADVDGVVDAGRVYIADWNGVSFPGLELDQRTFGSGVPEEDDRFGTTLAAPRQPSGGSWLIVGTPFEDREGLVDAGIVNLEAPHPDFFVPGAIDANLLTAWSFGGTVEAGARFGTSIAVLDLDANRWEDWMIGAPGETCANGVPNGGALYTHGDPIRRVDQSTVGRLCESGDGLGDRYIHPF